MNINYKFLIYSCIILFIIIIIIITIILIKIYFIKFTYYHENMLFNSLLQDVFNNNNIINNNNNWNIYIPKGYTTLETQLNNLKLPNKKCYIFGIKGCDKIVAKNFIWKILVNHYSRKISSNLMPLTFVYDTPNDLQFFKKDFYSSKNPVYILKKNIQRKEGLKLSTDYYDIINSKNQGYKIIQKYKTNLFLINKRKINLRIYFLVINNNSSFKYYISSLGKCIYTNKDYNNDINDLDFEKNITSYKLNLDIYNKNPKSLQDLQKYLGKNKSNTLFNNINKMFYMISVAIHPHLKKSMKFKNTISFQHFGADVVFDNNMNPFLLEFNKGPDMKPKDNDDKIMKYNIYYDIFHKTNIIKNILHNNKFYLIYFN